MMTYDLIHILVGALTAGLVLVHPVLTIVGTLAFMIYQLDEGMHIKNGAWKDIKEWMVGFYLAGASLLIWWLKQAIIM